MTLLIIINSFYILKALIYFFLPKNVHTFKADVEASKLSLVGVDIIVPMFNEEKVILQTMEALKDIDYPDFTITLIDDGSTDGTLELVRSTYQDCLNLRIISQSNKGKAAALNTAIEHSSNDIIVCIDADTLVMPDLLKKLIPYFYDAQVAAVAGNIKISNRNNLITKVQAIEYMTMYNHDRQLFESSEGILIIPGALGAFRREVLTSLGGYAGNTLAEDTELTLRILCNNYKIRNGLDLVGYTEAPASLKMFLRQRIRWKVGTFQVLVNYPFSHHNKLMSFVIIPYNWIFSMIFPTITSFIDFIFIYHILFKHDYSIWLLYSCFILIDSLTCYVIIVVMKEKSISLIIIIFQRMMLRQLSLLTHISIGISAITGNLFKWNKLTRYGDAKIGAIRKAFRQSA